MKIWIDILTPKQLLFFEPFVKQLRKKNRILCTSRNYREVKKLAKIRGLQLKFVGRYGGADFEKKLTASLQRTKLLNVIINKFSPDLTISFCSPEASRISFGLKIKHIAFSDSPHAVAVMKLSVPLVQKLLIPWCISKNYFTVYGIKKNDIISYKAIDAFTTVNRSISKKYPSPFNKKGKNILIRVEEDQAAYGSKSKIISIIKEVKKAFENENIVVLTRYPEQIKKLRRFLSKKIKILKMQYDGKQLLVEADVFIGSGGTMTAEAALLGVPTISYNAVPNLIEKFLVRKNLVKRQTSPKGVVASIKELLKNRNRNETRAKAITKTMEDPYRKLVQVMKFFDN